MRSKIQINLTPETHIINGMMHNNIGFPKGIAELVDNSLDQGASIITIQSNGDSISVSDNGGGCSDLAKMLRLGGHKRTATTKLGMYGVGLKDAAMGLGQILYVETVCEKEKRRCLIDWLALRNSNNWNHEAEAFDTDEANGTRITISKLHSQPGIKALKNRIAFMFAPGMWHGAQIYLDDSGNVSIIDPWRIPSLSSEICEEVEIDDTRGYRVTAGACDGVSGRGPFLLSFKHRILGSTIEPCGKTCPSSNFFAFVELYGDWPLLKNKDGLRDCRATSNLYEDLNFICKPLLEKLNKTGESIALSEIAAELNEIFGLSPEGGRGIHDDPANETRGPKENSTGTAKETGRGAKHEKTVGPSSESGKRKRRSGKLKPESGFVIVYDKLDENIIGSVECGADQFLIKLNESHGAIRVARNDTSKNLVRSIAASLAVNHQIAKITSGEQSQLIMSFESDDAHGRFVEAVSMVTSKLIKELD